jgi:hypothetical protein
MDTSVITAFAFVAFWVSTMVAINRIGPRSLVYRDRFASASVNHPGTNR